MKPFHTILLVEDEKDQAIVLADFLENNNYRVLITHTGYQVKELIGRYSARIHLAALDIMLPGTDGKELCKLIRSHSVLSDIPV